MASFKRAHLLIVDDTPPGHPADEAPLLALDVDMPLDASELEEQRIAREIGGADRLLEQASAAQLRLLQRLARAAPEQQLRFSGIETLKHFLEATAATKAAMADTELARLWKKVAAPTSAPGA